MLPLAQIKDLSISFGNERHIATAVDNISCDIPRGKITALIGESGSGKTLAALTFMQLLPAKAQVKGEILFSENGESTIDLLSIPEKEIRAIRGNMIAMIFQEPMTALNPVHTCGAQVMESLVLHKKLSKPAARAATVELFRKVELPDPSAMLKRYPHEISGGQKQRVMIAMAMSCGPKLLIADEPTTALDVRVQKNILELLKKLQAETGMSLLLITHDLALVADVADEMIVMQKGAIVEQGNAKKILVDPQHIYTKALLACRPSGKKKGMRLHVIGDPGHQATNNRHQATGNREQIRFDTDENIPSPACLQGKEEIILSVENLSVVFPGRKNIFGKKVADFTAVDNVSFFVKKNETVGLVGESGCGKTTLGKAILGLIKPATGKIIFNEKDIAKAAPAEMRIIRKDLQVVFQDPYGSLNPRLTIGNAIMEPISIHHRDQTKKQRKEKAVKLLEQVNMNGDMLNRYPHEFSGGQRQRICIARALALDPDFLIFDESVSALDVSVQAQVLNLINDLKSSYTFSSIFISHDLSVIRYISDRILVMNKGRIIEEGPAEEIFLFPKENYTKELLASVPGQKFLL